MAKYDLKCPNGHYTEVCCLMEDRPTTIACPDCGLTAKRVFSVPETIIPARWHYDKAGVREVTGGHSMHDIRHNAELRKLHLGDGD